MAVTTTNRREQESGWISELLIESRENQQIRVGEVARDVLTASPQFRAAERLNKTQLKRLGLDPEDLKNVLSDVAECIVDSLSYRVRQGPNPFAHEVLIAINGESVMENLLLRVPRLERLQNSRHFRWLTELTETNSGIRLLMDWSVQDWFPAVEYQPAMTINDTEWSHLLAGAAGQFADAIWQSVEEVA